EHLAKVERNVDGAVGPDPLGDLQAQAPGDQRCRLGQCLEIVQVESALAPNLQDVAKATSGDEPDGGAAPLHDSIGDYGGAVRDRGRRLGAEQRAEAVDHAALGAGWRRRDLAAHETTGRGADDEVGEGAADVDPDATPRRCWRRTTPSTRP